MTRIPHLEAPTFTSLPGLDSLDLLFFLGNVMSNKN